MDSVIAILSCIGKLAGTILNSVAIMFLAWWLRQTNRRINDLENVNHIKAWLKAIEDGESPSDLAYMREKGFLK